MKLSLMKRKTKVKKINKFKYTAAIILVLVVAINASSDNELVFDNEFFRKFNLVPAILKDEYLESFVNKIIIGRGQITDISVRTRYKKKFMVSIESSESKNFGHRIIYYLFLDNSNTLELLTKGSEFEFKGQLTGVTPLNSKRNEYIIDVIYMEGSTVIE